VNRNTVIAVSLAAVAIGGGIYLSTRKRPGKRTASPAKPEEPSVGGDTTQPEWTMQGGGTTPPQDTGVSTGAPPPPPPSNDPVPCDPATLPAWSAVKDDAGDVFLVLPGRALYDLAGRNHRATLVKLSGEQGWGMTTLGPPKPGVQGPGGQPVFEELRYDLPFDVFSEVGAALGRLIDWDGSDPGAEVEVLFGERIGSLTDPMDSKAQVQLADGSAPAVDIPLRRCIGKLQPSPKPMAVKRATIMVSGSASSAEQPSSAPQGGMSVQGNPGVSDDAIVAAVSEAFVVLRTRYEAMAAYDRAIAQAMRSLFPRADYPEDDAPDSWEAYLNAAPQQVVDAFDRIDRLAAESLDGTDDDERDADAGSMSGASVG